jgi:hypothetical protein
MCWHPHGTLAALSNERRFAIAHVARDNETTCREVFRSMHRVEFIAETSLCSCLVKTSPPSYCDSGRRSALTALATHNGRGGRRRPLRRTAAGSTKTRELRRCLSVYVIDAHNRQWVNAAAVDNHFALHRCRRCHGSSLSEHLDGFSASVERDNESNACGGRDAVAA